MRTWGVGLLLPVLMPLVSCEGKATTATDTGLEGDADTDSDADTDTELGPQAYAADVAPILEIKCSGCHFEPTAVPLGGFSFVTDAEMTGVISVDIPAMPLVDAGNPDNSYLWHKVAGSHIAAGGAGVRMPTGSPLRPKELDIIEAWILQGAQP